MTAHYGFAHQVLRFEFLCHPQRTVDRLRTGSAGAFLRMLIEQLHEGGLEPQDIRIHPLRSDVGKWLLVEMPPPQNPVEASWIAMRIGTLQVPNWLTLYPDRRMAHYFTLELPVDGPSTEYPSVLCAWDEDTHYNFGAGPEPTPEGFMDLLTSWR